MGSVISALRVHVTASSAELASELGCTRSNIEYRCKSLLERGRVSRRRIDDPGGFESQAGIEWRYSLTVPR
jgi:DNA-binding MarR family transcriptional regulator